MLGEGGGVGAITIFQFELAEKLSPFSWLPWFKTLNQKRWTYIFKSKWDKNGHNFRPWFVFTITVQICHSLREFETTNLTKPPPTFLFNVIHFAFFKSSLSVNQNIKLPPKGSINYLKWNYYNAQCTRQMFSLKNFCIKSECIGLKMCDIAQKCFWWWGCADMRKVEILP